MVWAKGPTEVRVSSQWRVNLPLPLSTEIEGFFNLITAHLIAVYEPDSSELSKSLAKILDAVANQGATDQTPVRYRV